MAQSSAETADVLDIDALMNSQDDEKNVSAVVTSLSSPSAMKQEPSTLTGGNVAPTPPLAQNGGPEASLDVIDLTRPVKTVGEASPSTSTALAASVANDIAHNSSPLKPTAVSEPNSSESLASTMQMVGMGGAFGGSHITPLGSELRLTPEEQAAAYKKANILALTSLAKRGGPSAREMLSIQAKLQEFLTSLISLAGKNGPHVKLTVQLLVSKLVTGAITEEEFAANIEKDLQSQHQPSLLPFLKSSVPHLKTRLQLQQGIMKELLQRMAAEKIQKHSQQPLAGGQQLGVKQEEPLQQLLPNQQAQVQQPQQQQQLQGQLQVQAQAQPPAQTQQLKSQPDLLQQRRFSEPSNPALSQSQQSSPQQQLQSQRVSVSIATTSSSSSPATSLQSLPQNLAKLTPEQQKFLYMHHLRRQQHLKAQQQQQSSSPGSGSQQSTLSAPQVSQAASAIMNAASLQTIVEKQQQLVKEQQVSLVMGGSKTATLPIGAKQMAVVGSSSLSQFGIPIMRGVTATAVSSAGTRPTGSGAVGNVSGRTSFADLKLTARSQSSNSSQQPVQAKGKGKAAATGKRKELMEQDDEEEDESMDIAGVNLQEETAHFLPQSLGESVSRTCKDEVFLNQQALRQKVATIARRYGIRDVSEEFLILLSHATQERLRDTVEKLTVISQHRAKALKDDSHYEVTSEVRGQLKVLESIDRINHKRKQEREKEKILRAAKSRSKPEDPEMAAKIKEQAKQLQLEEEQKIRNKAANATALAAIGRRKRPAVDGMITGSLSSAPMSSEASSGSGGHTSMTSLLGAPGVTRQHKRRITTRDAIFYMEQERATRKSKLLYKSFLK